MDIQDWFAPEAGSDDGHDIVGAVSFGGQWYTPTQVDAFADQLRNLARFAREQAAKLEDEQVPCPETNDAGAGCVYREGHDPAFHHRFA